VARVIVQPKTTEEWLALRAKHITSTEVSALFGLSPYMTQFELWNNKSTGAVPSFEPSERMKWGTRLQDAIAAGVCFDKGWRFRKKTEYIHGDVLRIGASFDFETLSEEGKPVALLEIKNVDALIFKEGWVIDGDGVEAPAHIELQLQHQLLVSGLMKGYICALVGGNRVVVIEREADKAIQDKILEKVKAFWKSVDFKEAPAMDFLRDADLIKSIYCSAEPGKVFDARDDEEVKKLVTEYDAHGKNAKKLEEARAEIKSKLLVKIGDAEKVAGDGFTVSAGVIGPKRIEAFERGGYRDFRVFIKKDKAK
jgi:putative phage-type endonuclease